MAEVKSSLIKAGKPRRYKRPANPREGLVDSDWAWAACAIAGEGALYINRQLNAYKDRPRYSATARVYNTNLAFLDILLRDFGGIVYTHEPRGPKWKPSNTWVLSGKSAGWFVDGILPHLMAKAGGMKVAQAQNLLALIRLQRGAPHRRTDEQLTEAERLYVDTVRLNKKGPPATTEREDTRLIESA